MTTNTIINALANSISSKKSVALKLDKGIDREIEIPINLEPFSIYEVYAIGNDFSEFVKARVLINSKGEISYLNNLEDGLHYSFNARGNKLTIISNDGVQRTLLIILDKT
jgi:hypothetical protein